MEKSEHFTTRSFEETQKLGERFAQKLRLGDVVCLYGELGSGKTTFVKGIAKGLGIQSRIISPTFVLIRQHKIRSKYKVLRIKYLYHVDLYRIDNGENTKDLGLEDLFEDESAIVVIEWAHKLGNLMPKQRWNVQFEFEGESRRKIYFKREGA